jgi:hypothetical protein
MSDTDSFIWIGGTAGTRATASNWMDLTTGTVAAQAPDYNSTATIGAGVTLLGGGAAASLTFQGDVTIAASAGINGDTLIADGNVILDAGDASR